MNEFIILTDSSADLSAEITERLGIDVLPLSVTIEENTYRNYVDNRELAPEEFYKKLREGSVAVTTAVNVAQYEEAMERHLLEGKDVLVLAFSSGLSATYQSAVVAAEAMNEKYPAQKTVVVDTLCASLGQGLLVYLAAMEKKAGKTMEEVQAWAEANKMNVCHWFTVDDLHFLKRGGRVSATTAMVGTMLAIKPVLCVNSEGRLVTAEKSRGRNASLKTLVDQMEKNHFVAKGGPVFISHGDCLADAQKVAAEVQKKYGDVEMVINPIGPVIGAHSGPGTVALFFMGDPRQ